MHHSLQKVGDVAQMVERMLSMHEAQGSIPCFSTRFWSAVWYPCRHSSVAAWMHSGFVHSKNTLTLLLLLLLLQLLLLLLLLLPLLLLHATNVRYALL